MTNSKEFLKNLERRTAKLRIKFEKEAHDREREEIQATVDGYNRWISENAIRQLMIK